jgi:hypothetical protein
VWDTLHQDFDIGHYQPTLPPAPERRNRVAIKLAIDIRRFLPNSVSLYLDLFKLPISSSQELGLFAVRLRLAMSGQLSKTSMILRLPRPQEDTDGNVTVYDAPCSAYPL